MEFTQKTKYFAYGSIATAVLLPLTIYAIETIPVTFSEGDVISASVLNNMFERINDATALPKISKLIGTWSCVESGGVRTVGNAGGNFVYDGDGLIAYRTNTYTITTGTNANNAKISTSVGFPLNPSTTPITDHIMALAENSRLLVIDDGASTTEYNVIYLANNRMTITQGVGWSANCNKTATAPVPADALTATVSGTSIALAWTDQSNDETGFKVQYKTSAKGTWTTAMTTAANASSYTITNLSAGKYWIRVIAKNSNGDAMSSSEVQAEVQ